jgi:hypothetical protein
VRSSRRSSRAACVLALTTAIAGVAEVSAHRRDEYLQAARLAIDPGSVQLELDLTPGIAVAEAIVADIDRNHDGALSPEEQRDYAGSVVRALTLEIDGTPVRLQLAATSFPAIAAMKQGEGIIRVQSTATLPHLSKGAHQLRFRNSHHPDSSVYLANALVPASNTVTVTVQRRDTYQTQLPIDYMLRAGPATSTDAWLLGSIAGAMVVVLGIRRSRAMSVKKAWQSHLREDLP